MKRTINWIPVFIALGLALIALALALPGVPILAQDGACPALPRCDSNITVTLSVPANSCACVQIVTACSGTAE